MLPDIVITSHLPPDPAKRAIRLDYHERQCQQLAKGLGWTDDLTVHTVCSGYTQKEVNHFTGKYHNHLTREDLPSKWEKHNYYLGLLYASKGLRATLFLDDDVVPRDVKEGEVEDGLCDTKALIRNWLLDPSQMCGQCAFFACAGLRFDAFWKANQPLVTAPPQVVGWAMMVRNDLGVLYDEELVTDPGTGLVSTDYPFRTKCMATGKVVVKHNRAFWKTFQSIQNTEKTSTWVGSHEDRIKGRELHARRMRTMFPGVFQKHKKPNTGGESGKGFFTA